MNNRFKFWSALFVASAFVISAGTVYAASYEELVKIYVEKENVEKQIGSSEQVDPPDRKLDERAIWEEIASAKDPSRISENGIRLLDHLVDDNVSRWNELEGFIGPQGYPRSIVAFNSALYSVSALLEMGDPDSSRKAYSIAKELFESRESLRVIFRSSGKEAFREKGRLRELAGSKWIDNQGYELWNVGEKENPPFGIEPVRTVRGYVNISEALSRKMVFLNSRGQVSSGIGQYAWDWRSGKVYRLRDDEGRSAKDKRSDPEPGDDNGNPGGDDDDDDDDNGNPGGDDDDDDDNGNPGGDDDDDDDNGNPGGDDDDDDDDNGNPGGDDDDDDDDNGNSGGNSEGSGPGNGNGNSGNPGNGGGNNNGSGPGSGNNGSNNGQDGDSDNGSGGSGNSGGNSDGSGPGNGNGNSGNPGNGGGNNNGSGPGSGNNGSNNGQDGDSDNGSGGSGNNGDNGNNDGSNSGLGDGSNPGEGSSNNNAGDSPGGRGTDNPGGN